MGTIPASISASRGSACTRLDERPDVAPVSVTPRGWCPSLFEPMAAGDGLLVRVKPRVRGLGALDLRAIAEAARQCGSGRIEITNRANLQVRGLTPDTAPRFAAAIVAAGLASPDPAAERRRNILLPAHASERALRLAAGLEAWLESDHGLAGLPAKFGFALSGGTPDPGAPQADITVREDASAIRLAGDPRWLATDEPVAAARALAHAFLALAAAVAEPPRRMAALVARVGADAVRAHAVAHGLPQIEIQPSTGPLSQGERDRVRGVGFPESGLPLTPTLSPPGRGGAAGLAETDLERHSPIGAEISLALPFGAADAAMLDAVAGLAERFGEGWLRVTSARELVLTGLQGDPAALLREAATAGFITEPGDPRRRIAACAGRPACASAQADVRADATRLAPTWTGPATLHVSGCAKGCAHPGAAAITLVATPLGYDMVLDGRPGAVPARTGLSLGQLDIILAERSTAAA